MKEIYSASNATEAHMVVNLLELHGIAARIEGEYLSGGIGELPAIGLVRVMANVNDVEQAKSVIEYWERTEFKSSPETKVKSSSHHVFGAAIISFILGITSMAIYHSTPITTDGIDYDGDGQIDEKWTYVNHMISKAEQDRNFDGRFDAIYQYDRNGLLKSSRYDENFDGLYETELVYENGNPVKQFSDTNDNSVRDYIAVYKNGVFVHESFLDEVTLKPVKVSYYGPFQIEKSELDTTGDGYLDTIHEYDELGELSRTYTRSKLDEVHQTQ